MDEMDKMDEMDEMDEKDVKGRPELEEDKKWRDRERRENKGQLKERKTKNPGNVR